MLDNTHNAMLQDYELRDMSTGQATEQTEALIHPSILWRVEKSSSSGQSVCTQCLPGATDEPLTGSANSSCCDASGKDLKESLTPGHTDLQDHSSGSADDECEESAYPASSSADEGYGNSACSDPSSSSGADKKCDGLADSFPSDTTGADTEVTGESGYKVRDTSCSDYAFGLSCADEMATDPNHLDFDRSVDGDCCDPARLFGSNNVGTEHPNHVTIKVQTERKRDEQSRHRREPLRLDGIMPLLQKMRDERSRDLCETLTFAKSEFLSQEMPLKTMLGVEVNREFHELETLSRSGMQSRDSVKVPVRIPDAEEVRRVKERWFQSGGQAQVGPVAIRREASALAASSLQRLGEVSGETWDANQTSPHMPRRNRPLRLLPSWARTLVVRNVPWSYKQEDLLLEWPPDGYDYLHLPCHFFEERPLGKAYINFVTYEAAAAFRERWHGRFLSQRGNPKSLNVTAAITQGRGPNLARIAEDKIPILAEVHFLPVLLDGGRRLDTQEVLAELSRARPTFEGEAGAEVYQ